MSSPNLFRSLKAQPPAVLSAVADIAMPIERVVKPLATRDSENAATGKIQSILSRHQQASKWPLLQSVQASAWEPTPSLSAEEKVRRLSQALNSKYGAYKEAKFSLPEVSGKLAEGLRQLGQPISAKSQASLSAEQPAVFRSRSSKLFLVSLEADAQPLPGQPSQSINKEEALLSLFARIATATSPQQNLRQSLRSLSTI